MKRHMAGLLGAAAALTAIGGAQAAPAPAQQQAIPQATSYAELLEPVANPAELLTAEDAQAGAPQATVQLAQYNSHHHNYRSNHHHHYNNHHHYRNGPYVPFFNLVVPHRRYYNNHHHHHNSHHNYHHNYR